MDECMMDEVTRSVLTKGLHAINLSKGVIKGTSMVLKALRLHKARIVFVAADADKTTEKDLLFDLCKKQGVKLETVPSMVFLGYAFSRSDRRKYPTPRKKGCWGSCAVSTYGSIATPEIEAFRAMFDPSAEDAPA
jgi:ribosomal protein L7Ae-like RNA K-turn-binding protein